jgi:hypothetical protein
MDGLPHLGPAGAVAGPGLRDQGGEDGSAVSPRAARSNLSSSGAGLRSLPAAARPAARASSSGRPIRASSRHRSM